MKDNISIIFTAIIGTFLIVLLPLYSILDRQDSMSYNVVLTETTNFVDNIRNNGFIDKESYYDYISALASTSNTYKVTMEAYRKTLIRETDENGNIIPYSWVEEIELYNTKDILEVLEGDNTSNLQSNKANNVYLFNQNDEIYVKVHNTNITAGSVIYNVVAGATNNEVINVSYGGVVNKVNWELYSKIQSETDLVPEVVMSVPVNMKNSTNIQKINEDGSMETIDCTIEDLDEYIGASIEELCGDVVDNRTGESYTYLYNLQTEEDGKKINKTINIAVELRRFNKVHVGVDTETKEDIYMDISELREADFNDASGQQSDVERFIINNYIELNGMYASVDIDLRKKDNYYVFDITLTNVRMSDLDYIASLASLTILPGLGIDENGIQSLGNETVQLELTDTSTANAVTISMPYNWKKLIKTKDRSESMILDGIVYAKQDIAFIISYTGINGQTDEEVAEAIKDNLRIYITETEYTDLEILTAKELNDQYQANIQTDTAGHVVVKFRYSSSNSSKTNHIELLENWIETNVEEVIDVQEDEEIKEYASGARSTEYQVLLDDSAPLSPMIALEGTIGDNDWYTSDVVLTLIPSATDTVRKQSTKLDEDGNIIADYAVETGGSGVYKNTLTLTGSNKLSESEVITARLTEDGTSYAVAKAYDYIGNTGNMSKPEQKEIKIDKTPPTEPKITLSGNEGNNGWYKSDVTINITPGTDITSKVDRTTYRIEGQNSLDETVGTSYTLTKEGKSTVIATTYDKAGNKTEKILDVYIDKATPPDAIISVISGEKNSADNLWYYTDVVLKVKVDAGDAISQLGTSSYRITGDNGIDVPVTEFEGNEVEISLTKSGTHNLTVYTYTKAGNIKETKYTVQIDKDAPNAPKVEITNGTKGDNDWYITNVELQVTSNGDNGTSGERKLTYTLTTNGVASTEREINNNGKITINQEGEHILKVYSRDIALNKTEVERTIKIDKTAPKGATIKIDGSLGNNDWYTSDVSLSYEGQSDSISGIASVELSTNAITEDTDGTTVVVTTKDNAGHTVTSEKVIKVDKTAPTDPVINLLELPTGTGITGVALYNKDVPISITPGTDANIDKTTYKVTKNGGLDTIISEREAEEFILDYEGTTVTVVATTYDKAGNISEVSRAIWINKQRPVAPTIVRINGTNIKDVSDDEIISTLNTVSLELSEVTEGNSVTVTLINQNTYKEIEKTQIMVNGTPIKINLTEKGRYSIIITQTNRFGTQSNANKLYYYTYE